MYSWQTASGAVLWVLEAQLRKRYGIDQAERDLAPLAWYINTGRASTDFIKLLSQAKPFMVARRLHDGGSYDEVIRRVKRYIGYEEEC
jgi:hypothetical protein